jgi:hypothetical protein
VVAEVETGGLVAAVAAALITTLGNIVLFVLEYFFGGTKSVRDEIALLARRSQGLIEANERMSQRFEHSQQEMDRLLTVMERVTTRLLESRGPGSGPERGDS